MTVIHDNLGNPIDGINPLPVKTTSSNAITVQTHNAVSVALSGSSSGGWIDCGGFDKIAYTLKNDAATSSALNIDWSNDGSSIHGTETPSGLATPQYKQGIVDIKAKYARITVVNGDSALAHTMSAWAYLKA